MKLLKFLKKLILSSYLFAHILIQGALSKIGRKFPKLILILVPDRIVNSYLKNDLSTHHINSYLKTLSISAKSELYNRLDDYEKERYCRKQWMSSKGVEWFEKDLKDNNIKNLLKNRQQFIDFLDQFLEKNESFKILCEIGTGDGRFLQFLENRFYNKDKFIGIDLNEEYIERNRNFYKKYEKIIFESGHISEIFTKITNKFENYPLLLLTVRTLTWFTQNEIENLFFLIKNSDKEIVFAFFEQNEMDLEKDFRSFIRSDIFFHSHNYPYLIDKSGLRVLKKHIKFHNNFSNDHEITMFVSNR